MVATSQERTSTHRTDRVPLLGMDGGTLPCLDWMGVSPQEIEQHWGQFLTKFILCCVTLDLSDNLTEMRLKGLT